MLQSVLEHCDFLNADISQSSVAICLRCGGISSDSFTNECVSERMLKIDQYLAKLCTSIVAFLTHSVYL